MSDQTFPLFDSHCHLDMLSHRNLDVDALVQDAFHHGMVSMLTIAGGGKNADFNQAIQQVASYQHVYIGAGVHPHNASELTSSILNELNSAVGHSKVVAVGEIGLDYFYNHSTPAEQRRAFIEQLRLAQKHELPVIIHTRDAGDDTILILQDEGVERFGGVIHCFSASEKLANAALSLGMYISFSGIVTFPKSTEIQDVAHWVPENRILCETDSPFLSPVPKRGRVNTPNHVKYVVEKLAEIRQTDVEQFAEVIVENTKSCFEISGELLRGK